MLTMAANGQDLGLDEPVLEGRMRGIRARRFEHRLAVAGESQGPGSACGPAVAVREAAATHFDVVVWGNGDVGPRFDIAFDAATAVSMAPQQGRAARRERGLDQIILLTGWLRCG